MKEWGHSTGTRRRQEAAKTRDGFSVSQLRTLRESPKETEQAKAASDLVNEEIADGIAVITEITDDMFELITIGEGEDARQVPIIKEEFHLPVLKFMGALADTDLKNLILKMLYVPSSNKDIQLLSKFNIIQTFLSKFYNACCLRGSYVIDEEVLSITLFMLRNNFFTIEEVEANLSLNEPIPFFKPGIVVDGLSVEKRSMYANRPVEVQKRPIEGPNGQREYCENRFKNLKTAVKEDFNKRLSNESDKEEAEARDRARDYRR